MRSVGHSNQAIKAVHRPLCGILVAAILCLLIACDEVGPADNGLPEVLRVGVLPDVGEQAARTRHTPLLDYLDEELGLTIEVIIPTTYDELLALFAEGKIDLAYLGGYIFIMAERTVGAVPIALRDVDTKFSSYLITGIDGRNKPFSYFKGKQFSFGARLSTSGHLMPRHFISEIIESPETYFGTVLYSGAHDTTVYNVRDGKADIAAVSSDIFDRMLSDGRIKQGEVYIWRESPPFADNVWTAHPDLGQKAIDKIRNAFLALTPSNRQHAVILDACGAGGYLPTSGAEFSRIVEIARQYGLIEADL